MRSATLLPRRQAVLLCTFAIIVTSTALAQATQDSVASLQQITNSLIALADRPSAEQFSARDLARARHDLLLALADSSPREIQPFFLPSGIANKLPASAQPYLETDADETGTVRAEVQDYAAGHKLLFFLNTDNEQLQLYFIGDPPHLLTGSRIRAHGKRLDNALLLTTTVASPRTTSSPRPSVAASTSGVQVLSLDTQNTFAAQTIAVLLVNFTDDTSQPFAFSDMQDLVFHTVSNWYMDNSQNQTWFIGDVFGWFTVPMSVTTCPDESQFINAANTVATNAGVVLGNYMRRVYIFPQTACTWMGLASIGGNPSSVMINGHPGVTVVAHELGHNLGLYHSHSLECPDTTLGGTNCQEVEYGDRFDIMGHYTSGHFNSFQKERLGWLNYGSSQPITTVKSSGSYKITPYESGNGVKALKILMSIDPVTGLQTWFYVEFRQLFGFDAFLSVYPASTTGILIHMATEGDGDSSFLLNANPQDATLATAALQVGQNFFDPGSGVSITLTSADANGATVDVQVGTSTGCTHSNPLVKVTPVGGVADQPPAESTGVPVTYTVSLKNQDNSACSPTGFLINVDLPTKDWTTSAPAFISSLAPQATFTTNLTVTAPVTASAGTYQITFHGAAWPNFNYTTSTIATFVVTSLSSITVTPANASVGVGLTQQFTATGHYFDASTQDLSSAVTWSSSNTSAATINSSGLATGIAVGETTITAALSGVSSSTLLTVKPHVLTAITVTPANPSVIAGATQQFSATGNYSDGSKQDVSSQVTWTSSNTAAATISSSGLTTGVAAGGTTIAAAMNGITGSTVLTVLPPVLNTITVTPANPSIPAGSTKQFTATGKYSDGTTQDVSGQATWTSSNIAAATISSSGLATGVAVGGTTIMAAVNGISGSTYLTVTSAPPPPNGVSLFSANAVPGNSAYLGMGLELGMKFTSDSSGSITGVRFYKASGDTGTHVGSLWTSDGQKLASVTFIGETDSGWQQANFTTPVAITANTLYVVTYSTPQGAFTYTDNYFFNGSTDNPPLHAPASGAVNGNGVYAYGTGNFPIVSNYARNYWVDVVFQ